MILIQVGRSILGFGELSIDGIDIFSQVGGEFMIKVEAKAIQYLQERTSSVILDLELNPSMGG